MRRRQPDTRRRLTDAQRTELLTLINEVPALATSKHPSVRALVAHVRELGASGVPWWAVPVDYRLAFGGTSEVADALDRLRAWSSRDWPDGPPRGLSVELPEDEDDDLPVTTSDARSLT